MASSSDDLNPSMSVVSSQLRDDIAQEFPGIQITPEIEAQISKLAKLVANDDDEDETDKQNEKLFRMVILQKIVQTEITPKFPGVTLTPEILTLINKIIPARMLEDFTKEKRLQDKLYKILNVEQLKFEFKIDATKNSSELLTQLDTLAKILAHINRDSYELAKLVKRLTELEKFKPLPPIINTLRKIDSGKSNVISPANGAQEDGAEYKKRSGWVVVMKVRTRFSKKGSNKASTQALVHQVGFEDYSRRFLKGAKHKNALSREDFSVMNQYISRQLVIKKLREELANLHIEAQALREKLVTAVAKEQASAITPETSTESQSPLKKPSLC